MLFENEKILLRALEPEDLELLYVWENDPLVWMAGNTRNPYSRFALKQYIANSVNDIYESKQLRLMIVEKQSGLAVGTVDLFDMDVHNSRVALGLFVSSIFQGKGLATEALHLTEEYVFNFLKLNQLYADIAAGNIASRNMFEKEKYEQKGILKNWIKTIDGFDDILVFQRFNPSYSK